MSADLAYESSLKTETFTPPPQNKHETKENCTTSHYIPQHPSKLSGIWENTWTRNTKYLHVWVVCIVIFPYLMITWFLLGGYMEWFKMKPRSLLLVFWYLSFIYYLLSFYSGRKFLSFRHCILLILCKIIT